MGSVRIRSDRDRFGLRAHAHRCRAHAPPRTSARARAAARAFAPPCAPRNARHTLTLTPLPPACRRRAPPLRAPPACAAFCARRRAAHCLATIYLCARLPHYRCMRALRAAARAPLLLPRTATTLLPRARTHRRHPFAHTHRAHRRRAHFLSRLPCAPPRTLIPARYRRHRLRALLPPRCLPFAGLTPPRVIPAAARAHHTAGYAAFLPPPPPYWRVFHCRARLRAPPACRAPRLLPYLLLPRARLTHAACARASALQRALLLYVACRARVATWLRGISRIAQPPPYARARMLWPYVACAFVPAAILAACCVAALPPARTAAAALVTSCAPYTTTCMPAWRARFAALRAFFARGAWRLCALRARGCAACRAALLAWRFLPLLRAIYHSAFARTPLARVRIPWRFLLFAVYHSCMRCAATRAVCCRTRCPRCAAWRMYARA